MAGSGGDQDAQGEKTEEATQTRREEFRKKGQVAQTKELATVLLVVAGIGLIAAMSPWVYSQIRELFEFMLGPGMIALVRQGDILPALIVAAKAVAVILSPVLLIVTVLGLFSSIAQVGFLTVEEGITPKFERIDPIGGLKRVFSMRMLMEGVKAIFKFVLVGFAIYLVLRAEIWRLPWLMQIEPAALMVYMGDITVKLLVAIALVMVVIAIGDYFFQWWDMEKQMMMSQQEIKEELKQREGDPLIRARIRRIQREMSTRRMMDKVPTADVIVTNPTHIAVALKYDASLPAPQVVAMGADLVAEKIKAIAREAGVAIVENKPLARAIFKTMKVGQVIPREMFVAVAEVLAYVYRLRKKTRNRGKDLTT